jgi:hypothetical protein
VAQIRQVSQLEMLAKGAVIATSVWALLSFLALSFGVSGYSLPWDEIGMKGPTFTANEIGVWMLSFLVQRLLWCLFNW